MKDLRLHLFSNRDYARFYKWVLALVISGSLFDWASTLFLGNPIREANPVIVTYALAPGSSWALGVSIWALINLAFYAGACILMYRIGRGESKLGRFLGMGGLYMVFLGGAVGHFIGGASWIAHLL